MALTEGTVSAAGTLISIVGIYSYFLTTGFTHPEDVQNIKNL
jgi:hypothetical protein